MRADLPPPPPRRLEFAKKEKTNNTKLQFHLLRVCYQIKLSYVIQIELIIAG